MAHNTSMEPLDTPRHHGNHRPETTKQLGGSGLSSHSPPPPSAGRGAYGVRNTPGADADPEGLGRVGLLTRRVCDTAAAVSAVVTAFVVSNLGATPRGVGEFFAIRFSVKNYLLLGGFALVWRAVCSMCGLYDGRRIASLSAECARVLAACVLASIAAVAFPLTSVSGAFSYRTLLIFALGLTLGMLVLRGGLRFLFAVRPKPAKTVLIAGSGPLAAEIADRLRADRQVTYQVAGFVDSEPQLAISDTQRHGVGHLADLEMTLMHSPIDEVVVGLPVKSHYLDIQLVVDICERLGIAVTFPAQPFRCQRAAVRLRQSATLLAVTLGHAPEGVRLVIKRIIDIIGASLALLVLAPVMLVVAAGIKLTSPGPVFFSQERYGYNRRRFRMFKFRTMVADADARQSSLEHLNEAAGPLFKIRGDPRVTRLGRWLRRTSVDELPQLFNVLRGDMSLVGPRPMAIRDVYRFPESWLMRRFSVLPGMTGLWQVSGRSELGYNAWADLDLKYIDEWSLAGDLMILARTVPAVLKGTGAE